MAVAIQRLEDLFQKENLEKIVPPSKDGTVWAYTPWGLFAPDDRLYESITKFNMGEKDVFDRTCFGPQGAKFDVAGSTFKSVTQAVAKCGGRVIQIDPKREEIVTLWNQEKDCLFVLRMPYLPKEEDDRAVKILLKEVKEKGYNAFYFAWENDSRVPKTITFPSGLERRVGYMRDGTLILKDEKIAVKYGRILDHPSPVKSMIVYYRGVL